MVRTAAVLGEAEGRGEVAEAEEVPLVRRTLHAELVDRIRTMIVEGRLSAGSRVHEGQLGESLGISRTPLREALKFLASEGLVELVPGKGAVVRSFSPRDIHEMLEVLGALEALAGRLICRDGSDDDIARLCEMHSAMLERHIAGDRREYHRLNQSIHLHIVAGSRNQLLIAQHGSLQARMRRVRFVANEGPDDRQAAVDEHGLIIAALQRRDGAALAEALERHLAKTWERVSVEL